MLRVGFLHRPPVRAALRELLRGHVRRLLGHAAFAHRGGPGERGGRLGLRDRQVRSRSE